MPFVALLAVACGRDIYQPLSCPNRADRQEVRPPTTKAHYRPAALTGTRPRVGHLISGSR